LIQHNVKTENIARTFHFIRNDKKILVEDKVQSLTQKETSLDKITGYEIGDIQLNTLFTFYQNKTGVPFKSAAFGIDFLMNTGDVDVGTGYGQYVIAPYLTASFYPADEILIALILKNSFHSIKTMPAGKYTILV